MNTESELLTSSELKMLSKLVDKKQKKLRKKGRVRKGQNEEYDVLTRIQCKLITQTGYAGKESFFAPEEPRADHPPIDLNLAVLPSTKIQEPQLSAALSKPVFYAVTITATTRVLCNLLVQTDDSIAYEHAWEELQNLPNRLTADEFHPCPPAARLGEWDSIEVSAQIVISTATPDFRLVARTAEDTSDAMFELQDLRNQDHNTVPETATRRYTDVDGKEIFLTVKDKVLIQSLLHSEVCRYTDRKRPEDVVQHKEVLAKIGPQGDRLLTQLRRLPGDNQTIRQDSDRGG